MPVYEYQCGKCGHEFEREQRISDDPVKTCPACRGRKVKRLISRTSFVLKGGGWYSDLYSSPGKEAPKGDSKGDSKADSKGDSKADSKSDSSADKSGTKGGGSEKKASSQAA